jgi:hypothetical protein
MPYFAFIFVVVVVLQEHRIKIHKYLFKKRIFIFWKLFFFQKLILMIQKGIEKLIKEKGIVL